MTWQRPADHPIQRARLAQWAASLLADPTAVILDSETTGLGPADFCSLSVLDMDGHTLYDGRFNPRMGIQPGAAKVHGLTRLHLLDAPDFATEYQLLTDLLFGRRVVVYNAIYDSGVWRHASQLRGLPQILPGGPWQCAMIPFSQFVGEWNYTRGDYRWQKLPAGDHSALGDCRATLAILRRMADELNVPTARRPVQATLPGVQL